MAKILVLDGVEDAVTQLQRILSEKGHEVAGFTDEETAIDHARTHRLDLLILETKLRKLSGIEVLEEIRKSHPAVKVIMLTGYPTLHTAKQAVKLGAREYCVKPIEQDELEQKVAHVLGNQG